MRIELREEDVEAFFDVPFRAYGPDSRYVSPLRSDLRRALDRRRNPLWGAAGEGDRAVITAHRDGAPVGRIVAHVHGASNRRHGWRRGHFGYFDCIDEPEVATALLDAAIAFARGHGCTSLVGNFNLTAMQQLGVVTGGFEHDPFSDMVWNPPHIPRLLRLAGFSETLPASTFVLGLDAAKPERLLTPAARERLTDPALTWVRLRRRKIASSLEQVREVLNDGFAHNPMFVPLTREEMKFQARDLSHVMDPAITSLVLDGEGAAGVVLCIPDFNPMLRAMRSRFGLLAPLHLLRQRLRRDRAVIVFYSVARRMQGRGLNPAMLHEVIRALQRRGYAELGLTWIADENAASLRQIERLGARPLHRIHLFERSIA